MNLTSHMQPFISIIRFFRDNFSVGISNFKNKGRLILVTFVLILLIFMKEVLGSVLSPSKQPQGEQKTEFFYRVQAR